MNRNYSVDDIVGELWRMGRTDSEAAFQDWLKRVPSLGTLAGAGQVPPGLAAMTGNAPPNQAMAAPHTQGTMPPPPPQQQAATTSPTPPGPPSDAAAAAYAAFANAAAGRGLHPGAAPPHASYYGPPGVHPAQFAGFPGWAPGGMPPQMFQQHPAAAAAAMAQFAVSAANTAEPVNAAPTVAGTPSPPPPPPPPSHSMAAANRMRGGAPPPPPPRQTVSNGDNSAGNTEDELDADGNVDVRRQRRMLSNRESARRSRRRKQEHLSTLEGQIAMLEHEKSTLESRLAAAESQLNNALAENAALRAGREPSENARPAPAAVAAAPAADGPMGAPRLSNGMAAAQPSATPSTDRDAVQAPGVASSKPQADDTSMAPNPTTAAVTAGEVAAAAAAAEDDCDAAAAAAAAVPTHAEGEPSSAFEVTARQKVGTKMERSESMQRVASLEHLHKRTNVAASRYGAPAP